MSSYFHLKNFDKFADALLEMSKNHTNRLKFESVIINNTVSFYNYIVLYYALSIGVDILSS